MQYNNVAAAKYKEFIQEIFCALGITQHDAMIATDILFYADSHGIKTHGAQNLINVYAPKIKAGDIDSLANSQIEIDHDAVAKINGNKSLGLVTAHSAMQLVIRKASKFGIGCVTVNNSTHFGCAGYYSAMALEHDQIGIAMTNLGMQGVVKPFGTMHKILGSNPFSFSAPASNMPAFNLDMSVTVTSAGKIKKAIQENKKLPEGLLFNLEGKTVTDPAAYLTQQAEIALLGGQPTTGGYKGYGLALLVDILCGVLTGAGVGANPENLQGKALPDTDVGHFFLAIDIQKFQPTNQFKHQLNELLTGLKNAPMNPGFPSLSYPGFSESLNAKHTQHDGITLSEALITQLNSLADELKLNQLQTISHAVQAI